MAAFEVVDVAAKVWKDVWDMAMETLRGRSDIIAK
jgi:hypothetical protein